MHFRSFGRVQKKPGDSMEDLNLNMAIWGILMNTTLRAAVHLRKGYDKNLRFNISGNQRDSFQGNRKAGQWSDKNHWPKPDQLPRFAVGIDKLIALSSLSICHCQSLRLLRLCALLGKMGEDPVQSWKQQSQWYSDNDYFSELNRSNGQPMEFEWKTFQGFTTVGILNEIQQMMRKLQCEPENFTGRIIFMSMFNDIVLDAKGNCELCMTEITWVSFGTLSMCLPLKTLFHFPLNVGFLSFLTLGDLILFPQLRSRLRRSEF